METLYELKQQLEEQEDELIFIQERIDHNKLIGENNEDNWNIKLAILKQIDKLSNAIEEFDF